MEQVEKVLAILNDVYIASKWETKSDVKQPSFNAICCKHNLDKNKIGYLKSELADKKLVEVIGKYDLFWHPGKSSPTEKMAELFSTEIDKRLKEYKHQKYEESKLKKPGEKPKVITTLQDFDDVQLVNELRKRGFTVTAVKEVVQIINL